MDTDRHILTIDIGGSGIKATVLDKNARMVVPRHRLDTPAHASPENVMNTILELVKGFPPFDRVSVGFPGYVKHGIIITAVNLGTEQWYGVPLATMIATSLGKPVRLVNDADLLGLGVIEGKGLELMITLGTGFGSALYMDGHLLPHLELAHHPLKDGKDYDQYIGKAQLKRKGKKVWNQRMRRVIEVMKVVFNYDTLYIGGGSSSKLTIPLDDNIKIVSNRDGIKGGVNLWHIEEDDLCVRTFLPVPNSIVK
jgi:polyphosphate glucokinase